MGAGIAQVFIQSGFDVSLNDLSGPQLQAARNRIAVSMLRASEKGHLAADDVESALARLETTQDLESLGQRDLIVESATEKETVEKGIFAKLTPHLATGTLLTTNTSSLSITGLAATTDRPERFMGLHFMNPVPVMKLVELIRGIATDDQTCASLEGVVCRLGKTPTTSEDYPAFIVNRVLIPMINEAVYALCLMSSPMGQFRSI